VRSNLPVGGTGVGVGSGVSSLPQAAKLIAKRHRNILNCFIILKFCGKGTKKKRMDEIICLLFSNFATQKQKQ
jgi:hypothetical protein